MPLSSFLDTRLVWYRRLSNLLLSWKARDCKSFKVSTATCRLMRLIAMTSVATYTDLKIMVSVRLFASDHCWAYRMLLLSTCKAVRLVLILKFLLESMSLWPQQLKKMQLPSFLLLFPLSPGATLVVAMPGQILKPRPSLMRKRGLRNLPLYVQARKLLQQAMTWRLRMNRQSFYSSRLPNAARSMLLAASPKN